MDSDMSLLWKGREEEFFGALGYAGFVAELRRAYGTSPKDTKTTFVDSGGVSAQEDLEAAVTPHNNQALVECPRDIGKNMQTNGKGGKRSVRRHTLPTSAPAKQPESTGRRRSSQLSQSRVMPDTPSPTFPLRPLPARAIANASVKRVFDGVELVRSPARSSQTSSTSM
ncbi:hypothetical protein FS749_014647 [Ceratobasidium sp. UAMH 11750]|nr:hypothetical protein FS749_014647 [Ceratobasidium sp. UAMH 11750]